MSKIIYFGTLGSPGHFARGIDKELTNEETEKWSHLDCDNWIDYIYHNPGYGSNTYYDEAYTRYCFYGSVDDERPCSHTNLFWEGEHSEDEIVSLIKGNDFLSRQFKPFMKV